MKLNDLRDVFQAELAAHLRDSVMDPDAAFRVNADPLTISFLPRPGYSFAISETIQRTGQYGGGPLGSTGLSVVARPGEELDADTYHRLSWRGVMNQLDAWLARAFDDSDAPGFWEVLYGGVPQMQSSEPAEASFTPEEQDTISRRLDELAEQLLDLNELSGETANALLEGIAELKGDLDALNRRQWWRVAVGTLMTLGLRFVVTADSVRWALDALSSLLVQVSGVRFLP